MRSDRVQQFPQLQIFRLRLKIRRDFLNDAIVPRNERLPIDAKLLRKMEQFRHSHRRIYRAELINSITFLLALYARPDLRRTKFDGVNTLDT